MTYRTRAATALSVAALLMGCGGINGTADSTAADTGLATANPTPLQSAPSSVPEPSPTSSPTTDTADRATGPLPLPTPSPLPIPDGLTANPAVVGWDWCSVTADAGATLTLDDHGYAVAVPGTVVEPAFAPLSGVATGDFTGDGLDDVVLAVYCVGASVGPVAVQAAEQSPNGTFQLLPVLTTQDSVGYRIDRIAVVDGAVHVMVTVDEDYECRACAHPDVPLVETYTYSPTSGEWALDSSPADDGV